MSSSARRQIDLVLRHAVREYTGALSERLQAMYATHSAKGRLQSGATVRAAIRIMDEMAGDAVQRMSADVLEIAGNPDSFSAFKLAMSDLIQFFRDQMPTIVRMASGRMPCEPNGSIERAAYELFEEMESRVDAKVEIAEYSFNAPSNAAAPEMSAYKKMKTGRPSAAFWDEMWARIACDLYVGDLKPRTQSEIERAMLDWIESQGHSAATSTVRARARRLWDLIQIRE